MEPVVNCRKAVLPLEIDLIAKLMAQKHIENEKKLTCDINIDDYNYDFKIALDDIICAERFGQNFYIAKDFLKVEGSEPVGFLRGSIERVLGGFVIDELYVSENYRSLGIGSVLLRVVESYVIGNKFLNILSISDDPFLNSFLIKKEFKECGCGLVYRLNEINYFSGLLD